MSVVKRLCYLCYHQEGVEAEATHKYMAGDGIWYTVCPEHYKLVKNDGYQTKKVKTIEVQY